MTWLYVPQASAPASEPWTSASDWPFRILEQSCTWRGKPSASTDWFRRCKRVSWIKRLCGRMPHPSTADDGVDKWISSLRGSRASHTPAPGTDKDSRTHAISPRNSSASFARWHPPSSSWRTSQTTFDWACQDYSVTWPSSGSMRSGILSQPPKSVRPTLEGECSFSLPTPTAGDSRGSRASGYSTASGRHTGTTLVDALGGIPDPNTSGYMMGLPPLWMNSGPSATQLSHWSSLMRSALSRLGWLEEKDD